MADFVHLHVHTEYSLLDGANRIPKLVEQVKALGQPAVAITDHGVMYGAIDFYKECKKQGIKPIIGCEVYVAPRTRHDKQYGFDNAPYHLILLCENHIGYQNLIKMVSCGFTEGFYSKPRIDRELLEQHHEGIIALSACLGGEIPRLLTAGNYAKAKETALYYAGLFGENHFYLELQNHGIAEQKRILPLIAELSRETSIPMVATNDSHYLRKEDAKMQNIVVCISINRTVHDNNNMEFATDEFYIKSDDEMRELFGSYEGAIENTKKIADMCELDFEFGKTKLPHFHIPGITDNAAYFRDMCYKGLYEKYGATPEQYIIDRLEYELNVIIPMGYVDYYLIVYDFIAYAKSQGIPVGPGRGSGAGSLAAYCVGITGIDPMKYNLLFERFLNPERISMPDFDIDFCYERRQEVIDYVVEKYGSDHVAQIITFGTMAARGALRDVGRALGMSYGAVDQIAKAVPFELGMTLDLALDSADDFKKMYDSSTENRELIDTARKVEGMVRHASTHAAGVVITQEPVDFYVPLQKNDEAIVTQYTMGTLEELGLLKMDFLGLRNLTVIHDVEQALHSQNIDFDAALIPLDDPAVYRMMSRGQTNGVFQFESSGMKSVLVQLRPEHFEDLIAVISLYRPGPMDSIPRYIQNRHNPALVTYAHPLLKPILEVTYGCIVYQEQVMEICRKLAGYSYGRADLVRRAMSKKKHDIMEQERKNFVFGATKEDGSIECVGAIANGVDEATANAIFDEMNSFASYAFNKSHAAAYAFVSYQTAYLKCHYPKEYMAALLTSMLENTDKVSDYIAEAQKMNIAVLPPSINESTERFTVCGNAIRFGFMAVKGVGKGFILAMVNERQAHGPFLNLLDFLERLHGKELNKRVIESLIKCGALDDLGHNRQQLMKGYAGLLESIETEHKNNVSGQLNLFGMGETSVKQSYQLPEESEFSTMQKLAMEKEVCGMYLSGHPMADYSKKIKQLKTPTIATFFRSDVRDGDLVKVIAILSEKRVKLTKKNDTMAFATLEDETGSIEMLVFPQYYQKLASLLADGKVRYISGRLKIEAEESPRLICESILTVEQALEQKAQHTRTKAKKQGVYLKILSTEQTLVNTLEEKFRQNIGALPVYYYYTDQEKYIRLPQSLWVQPTPSLEQELKDLLGSENVVVWKTP